MEIKGCKYDKISIMLLLNLHWGCSDNRVVFFNHQMNSRYTQLHFMLPFKQNKRTNHASKHQPHHEKSHQKLKNYLTIFTRKLKLVPVSLLGNTDPFTHPLDPTAVPYNVWPRTASGCRGKQDISKTSSWSPITGTQAFQRKSATTSLLSVQATNLLVQNYCDIEAHKAPKALRLWKAKLNSTALAPSLYYWLVYRHKRKNKSHHWPNCIILFLFYLKVKENENCVLWKYLSVSANESKEITKTVKILCAG